MSLPTRDEYLFLTLLLVGTLLLLSGCLSAQPPPDAAPTENLTFYTEQMPPYNYEENGTLKGISVDLLEAVTEKMGKKVSRETVHLASWTEGYQAAITRNTTVLFTTARLPERERSFKWAGPVAPYTNVLFARPDRGITLTGPESLNEYRIGVIADDVAIQQLLDAGVNQSRLDRETNVSAIIVKLDSGEIDLWCYTEEAGRYFARRMTGNSYTYRVVGTLPALEGYYAFSRDIPDSTVEFFQQALDALKQEKDAAGISTYERILGRYVPSVGLSHLNYLTEEFAPFNYQEGGNTTGISVEILEAVFRNIGVNRTRADVRIVPLTEGLQAARNNTGTVLFSLVRTPEREPLFKWAGPFTRSRFVLFAPLDRNITIASPEDLNSYRIGAVQDSVENYLLLSRGVHTSQLVPGSSPDELFRMLERGQIDLWATGDLAGRYQIEKAAADPDDYEMVYTLGENDFYYVFSKDVPDTLVGAFQDALDTVRNQKDAQGVSEYERIIYRYIGVGCTRQSFSDDQVMMLVNTTAAAIGKNATDTFRRISAGESPYRDQEFPALYVFVYDTNVTMVAHADNIRLVGVNYKGKTDVAGKPFREEIVAGAQKNGTGWVDYIYINPVETGLYYKTTYYRFTSGSDGNSYVVCSGNFKRCGT